VNTVRKLNRDVAKLEGFKRNLLHCLQATEEVRSECYLCCAVNEPALVERQDLSSCTRSILHRPAPVAHSLTYYDLKYRQMSSTFAVM
jgi:hypothetical protein